MTILCTLLLIRKTAKSEQMNFPTEKNTLEFLKIREGNDRKLKLTVREENKETKDKCKSTLNIK